MSDDFGHRSAVAREAVAAIYDASGDAVSDAEVAPAASASLARRFGLTGKRPSPERLRRAIECYYASVVRLVTDHALGGTDVLGEADTTSHRDWPWHVAARGRLAVYDVSVETGSECPAVDLFGPLYQDLFPRTLRHGLGEYYTPRWLAEHVLDTVGYSPEVDCGDHTSGLRLLDPTCGSGVFLLAAIGRIRAAARSDLPPEELGRHIIDSVAGFDVNPLAVLTARANYLLAIRDLLPEGPPCPAPPVYLRDSILDAGEPDEIFDYVVGNPPWIAWDNLDDDYRERTKPLWQRYGLFSLDGTKARHGGGKKDLSMLVLYRAADRYLCRGGRLGFVVTQTLFQTKGAGDGFRRFRLGDDGEPLAVLRVDDLAAVRPFAGASNWTATVALEKGRETRYPVPYVQWRKGDMGATGVSPVSRSRRQHGEDNHRFARTACRARPIDSAHANSPWIVLPEGFTRNLDDLIGRSDYVGNLGANSGGANGVYWVEVVDPAEAEQVTHTAGQVERVREITFREHRTSTIRKTEPRPLGSGPEDEYEVPLPNGRGSEEVSRTKGACPLLRATPATSYHTVTVRNLATVGKRPVEQVEASIEAELLYPLVRWGDLGRWQAVPKTWLLLAQDVETRSGIDEATMRRRWPLALAYLARFRDLLERRAAYRRYQSAGPFWSMYNVGPYTLSPIKVVWRRMDRRINAAVVEPIDDALLGRRPVVVQETCVQVAVDSADEAHYLAAVLNSAPANFLVTAHSVRGGKGFGTPSMLDYLNVRRFDPGDPRHRELARLSRDAHEAAAREQQSAGAEREIDETVAGLWGLAESELTAIGEYLKGMSE